MLDLRFENGPGLSVEVKDGVGYVDLDEDLDLKASLVLLVLTELIGRSVVE